MTGTGPRLGDPGGGFFSPLFARVRLFWGHFRGHRAPPRPANPRKSAA